MSKHRILIGLCLLSVGCEELDVISYPLPGGESDPGSAGASLAALGERLFHDPSLSASGTLSCAGCHDPAQAFTGSNDPGHPEAPVSQGAFPALRGDRNSPTAMYQAATPAFSFVSSLAGFRARGGLFWDGRADTLAEQAEGPFVNPREMAMPSHGAVAAAVRRAPYRAEFSRVFGAATLADDELAYSAIGQAIEAFERTAALAPFSSKFDRVLRGEASFSADELLGFTLFMTPDKGNCAACHTVNPLSSEPRDWLFTNFTYEALGVPRNPQIQDNDDPQHFDLGLCARAGLRDRLPAEVSDPDALIASLCGAFKVPTLRNVARTAPYMHNGALATLRDAVAFYATRDTNPERWYPRDARGTVRRFDDLPSKYAGNVNVAAPFDRKPGQAPRLSETEIDQLVAFLHTLTDGV